MNEQDKQNQTPERADCGRTQAGPTHTYPDFNLDDFTDYVAFHIKCDQIAHGSSTIDEKMSRKKCRFCD